MSSASLNLQSAQQRQQDLQETQLRQQRASHPKTSAWVDASAGTGKTKVLSDRVLRLLLEGVPPSKLLALTFTKAAAAEMEGRVMEALSMLARTEKEQDLRMHLTSLCGSLPEPKQAVLLERAKTLIFKVLEDPIGLRIATIHSFAQQLLSAFPQEAGFCAPPTLLDEQELELLKQKGFEAFYDELLNTDVDGQSSTTAPLKEAYAYLLKDFSPPYIKTLILDLKSPEAEAHKVERALEATFPPLFSKQIDDQMLLDQYQNIFKALRETTSKQEQTFAQKLRSAFTHDTDRADTDRGGIETSVPDVIEIDQGRLYEALFTQSGTPSKKLLTKKTEQHNPELLIFLQEEQERLRVEKASRERTHIFKVTKALHALATAYLEKLNLLKRSSGRIDFDDVITTTAHLLGQNHGLSWVMFKLDGGIDHILVDEAQDTNPAQWEIILALASDFFSGKAQSKTKRTLFVVGDQKQSIYSFQGSDPTLFKDLKAVFAKKIQEAQQRFESISLTKSFRSAPEILSFVNQVFGNSHAMVFEAHATHRLDLKGQVDMRPLSYALKENPYLTSTQEAQRNCAQNIAQEISTQLQKPSFLVSRQRPLQAKDFLILVQRRTYFMHQVIRALKKQGIAVAGPDRYLLKDHEAIKDLLNFGAFLCYPEDDLRLAALLKSPLFCWSDEDLQALLPLRRDEKSQSYPSLWRSICVHERGDHKDVTLLKELTFKASTIPFYDLLQDVLVRHKGLQKFLSRFGADIEDVLQDFLDEVFTLSYDKKLTLTQILETFSQNDIDKKRNFDANYDAVRIMTVHGSKGLQAPIVYLADTTRLSEARESYFKPQYSSSDKEDSASFEHIELWYPSQPTRTLLEDCGISLNPSHKNVRNKEYERLLYVALTRAEERLIITGWCDKEKEEEAPPGSWYDLCLKAAREKGVCLREYLQASNLPVAIEKTQQQTPPEALKQQAPQVPVQASFPEILHPLKEERNPKDPESPSTFGLQRASVKQQQPSKFLRPQEQQWAQDAQHDAKNRGIQLHRALEDTLTGTKNSTAFQELSSKDQEIIQKSAKLILEGLEPEERLLLEVSVAGKIREQEFIGQIDLLILNHKRASLRLIDFKTGYHELNLEAPQDFPASLLAQLAIYRKLISYQFPKYQIQAELFFLDRFVTVSLDESFLNAYLENLLK